MIKKKIVIGVFTGNRAEYGLQYPIIKAISEHKKLDYRLIVSGSHLEKKFGETISQIKKDKLKISAKIKLKNFSNENSTYTSFRIAETIFKMSKVLRKIKPDFMLVNADRYETFAAAIASTQMNIPTCHVEGGDITQGGALDDSIRHAITKLSHLHFVTNYQSYKNILKLGEEKWRVFNVGLSINDIVYDKKKGRQFYLSNKYNIDFNRPVIIFTQHSLSTEPEKALKHISISLKSLQYFIDKKNYQIIITYPNNDYGHKDIINKIKLFNKENKKNSQIVKSLGNFDLHSFMLYALTNKIVIVGNSSFGIKEAVAFKCPVVNIGERQAGRLKPINVVNAMNDYKDIIKKILQVTNKNFKNKLRNIRNPYFKKNTGKKIANIISKINLNKKLIQKKITYLA
jgi:UDP-hydrolysing UDP-N-acetyl-D-glucosamine 2-epimerase